MNSMNRKQFLKLSGLSLTIPGFLEMCSSINPRLTGKSDDPIGNAEAKGFEYPILKAISTGITAPNPHNVQPWKVKIINPTEMLLFVDEKRLLPVTDPPTRQIHIGQGTFLELLKVGAAKMSYKSEIKLFPEGEYTREEIGKKPVAKVSLIQDTSTRSPLYEYVTKRTTDRSEYYGDELSKSEAEKLSSLGKAESSELGFILGKKEILPYIDIFNKAMEVESYTRHLNDESRIWFRFSDTEIQKKRDGIALPDQGVTGFTRFMAETFFMGPEPDKFNNKTGLEVFLSRYRKKIDSTKGIVYWKTKTNTMKDWVLTGMDYARFHLGTVALGFKMHPLSQVLQEYAEMETLRGDFEKKMGIMGKEKIQMIARLGRGDYFYLTPRRNLNDIILG
jgi:hypothetical protein